MIFVYLANRLQHASVAIEFCNYLVKLIRLFFICGEVLVFGVFLPETLGGFFHFLLSIPLNRVLLFYFEVTVTCIFSFLQQDVGVSFHR